MQVRIKTIPEFDRQAKRLSKKYHSLKDDLKALVNSLRLNPQQGVNLGRGGTYKVRMAIASKGGGKSGGARVLYYSIKVVEPDQYEVTLLTIFDKSEMENVSDAFINNLVEQT